MPINDEIIRQLMQQAPPVGGAPTPFRRTYIGPGDLSGRFQGANAISALLQMTDPMGLSSEQMNQNSAMRGPLYQTGLNALMAANQSFRPGPTSTPTDNEGAAIAQRHSFGEDLNSVMLKFDNWRKAQTGQELNPQERVTQGFMDIRNPNSRY